MLSKFRSNKGEADIKKQEKKTQQTLGSPNNQIQASLGIDQNLHISQDELIDFMFCQAGDYFRSELAHNSGGFVCSNKKQIEKLRSVGKQMIKMIGKKILSGQLNLTKISFPIKACAPKTALQNSVEYSVVFPHFMNIAANHSNPLERFKFTVVTILSAPSYIDMFLKPLNPIIGETLQAELKDGTKIYCEQISHHPPISYFLIYGPNQQYQFSGYYDFEISPGLNSLSLKNIGKRKFTFKDGTQITATYPTGEFSNTFIGTSRIQQIGQCHIRDEKNDIQVLIQFGKIKKRPTDYYQSKIRMKGKNIADIRGSYCGFVDINSKRYWDLRHFEAYQLNWTQNKLPSDWSHRQDVILLAQQKLQDAQKQKERLEQIQRTDDKMRKKHQKALNA